MGNSGDDRHRSRILDRVVSMRRRAPVAADQAPTTRPSSPADELSALRVRLDHLEAALEGLQDAVYRDAQRHARELAQLRHEIQPAEMARALSTEARRRGV
jgi:hypothetical protein